MYRYLREHPSVFMSRPKEPQFFAADEIAKSGMRYPDDLDAYVALFDEAGSAPAIGEASTTYMESPAATTRIAEFAPGARLIAMVRNPIDMMHSLHAMRVQQGYETVPEFTAALEEEKTRPGFGTIGDQQSVRYRDRARFGEMIAMWSKHFGRDRVHVIVLEDLGRDPAHEYRRTLEFLGLDPDFVPSTFERHNVSRKPRSMFLARLNARLPRRPVPRTLAERASWPLVRVIRRLNNQSGARQRVPDAVRATLQAEFASDVALLSEQLGRNMSERWWGQGARS